MEVKSDKEMSHLIFGCRPPCPGPLGCSQVPSQFQDAQSMAGPGQIEPHGLPVGWSCGDGDGDGIIVIKMVHLRTSTTYILGWRVHVAELGYLLLHITSNACVHFE